MTHGRRASVLYRHVARRGIVMMFRLGNPFLRMGRALDKFTSSRGGRISGIFLFGQQVIPCGNGQGIQG